MQRAVLLSGVGWLVASSSATNAILVRPPRSFDASVSSMGWFRLGALVFKGNLAASVAQE
jgi:hypothetical protein